MNFRFTQCVSLGIFFVSLRTLKAQIITVHSSYTFTSENYPENYPNNYNQTWCFDSESRLLLSFNDIDIEKKYDFIMVWESSSSFEDTQLLRWSRSGDKTAPTVLSSGNNLCMYFQTDSLLNKKGFSGKVEAVSDSYVDSCSGFDCNNGVCLGKYDRCNGFVDCGNGNDEICFKTIVVDLEEEFKSLYYDEGGYINNHHYTWYFTTKPGMQLEIQFSDIDTETDYPVDLIRVGNGVDVRRNRLLTWYGVFNDSLPLTVRSSGSAIWVHFTSDETNNGRGFAATVWSINTQEDIQCDDDYFHCDIGVCIPEGAHCDGFEHCHGGQDEEVPCLSRCSAGQTPCSDGKACFPTDQDICGQSPICFESDDQYGCEVTIPVEGRYERQLRDFSQSLIFTTNITEAHLLLNLFFIRTESDDVEVNLTLGENELTSPPLFQRNGIVEEYVLTQRSSGQVLWLKFHVKGILLISANLVTQDYNLAPGQPSCPEDLFVGDADGPVEWTSPPCFDQEDGELISTCLPSSGDMFLDGETIVICMCIDDLNLNSSCNFKVTKGNPDTEIDPGWPLIIGVAVAVVVVVIIGVFAVFCLMSYRRRQKDGNRLPLYGGHAGYQNQTFPQDVPLEPLIRSVSGRVYDCISEMPGGPARQVCHTADEAEPNSDYSCRVYSGSDNPIRPERDVYPISSGGESSYYSRQFPNTYQNE